MNWARSTAMALAVLGATGLMWEVRHAAAQEGTQEGAQQAGATATIIIKPKPNRPLPRPDAPAAQDAATAVLDETVPPEAEEAAPEVAPNGPGRGPVTNLPLPRYVSLKGGVGNARRGPGVTHRIDWVFTHAGMPLRVTAEHENWRRVEDAEGMGGWVHYILLSGVRTALVTAELAEFHSGPDAGSDVVFKAEAGVIGRILECEPNWCRLSVQGDKGWLPKQSLWGVDPGEIIE